MMSEYLDDMQFKCTGCEACIAACVCEAIKIRDIDGSPYPEIKRDLCLECGSCMRKCPAISPSYNNNMQPKCFAVWASDQIRTQSTSGGMFTLLAESIISEGGVVCGAAYDDQFYVKHIFAKTFQELEPLRGSKYVQSETRDSFITIKTMLNNNETILFTGCPCQVAGLYAYLGKDYQNLITVDFLCYCAPSSDVFQQFLNETFDISELEDIYFRKKKFGWEPLHFIVQKKDGSEIVTDVSNNAYERAFHMGLLRKEACITCDFSRFPRQGDLTIGDFWRIEEFDSSWNDNKGTSLVLINNLKGEKLFKKAGKKFQRCEEIPYTVSYINRFTPESPEKIPYPAAIKRFHYLRRRGYSIKNAVSFVLDHRYDLSILANWSMPNYGAHLTHYALYSYITSLGFEAIMAERIPSCYGVSLAAPPLFNYNPYPEWALCKPFEDRADALQLNGLCDTVLVGSDQNWNRYMSEAVGEYWFLDFIHDDKRKISYASSFGFDMYERNEKQILKTAHFIKKFDAVSVREESGINICKDCFGIEAECVLDPVFLCDLKVYDELIDRAESNDLQDNYVLFYILDIGNKGDFLPQISKSLDLVPVYLTDGYDYELKVQNWTLPVLPKVFVEDWLKYMKNSSFVITDSFHGVCFAILFRKQFIAIINEERGGARFTSLLSKLNLLSHSVHSVQEILHNDNLLSEIDYHLVYKILNKEKEKSELWLKHALTSPVNKPITDNTIMQEQIDNIALSIKQICSDSLSLKQWLNGLDLRAENIDKHIITLDSYVHNLDEHLCKLDMYAHSIDEHLMNLDAYTHNIDEHVINLDKYTHNIDKHLMNLDKYTHNIDKHLMNLDIYTHDIDGHVIDLDAYTHNIDEHLIQNNGRLLALNKDIKVLEKILSAINNGQNHIKEDLHNELEATKQSFLQRTEAINKKFDIIGCSGFSKAEKLILCIPRDICTMVKEIKIFTRNYIQTLFNKEHIICWDDREKDTDFSVWQERVKLMSTWIEEDISSIMDLGCGAMTLKKYLMKSIKYYPVDYLDRGEGVILRNFNKKQFFTEYVDTIFVSGCLEYIMYVDWFINKVTKHAKKSIILSYCTLEKWPNIKERRNRAWCNDMTTNQLIKKFDRHGFVLSHFIDETSDVLLKFIRK